MIKTIHCDQFWAEGLVKIFIKTTIENTLNLLREKRLFNLGENTIFEDLTLSDIQITAGTTFKGLIKIEKGPSEEILVNINYDENSFMNKSLWEGIIEPMEEVFTQPL